MHPPRVTSVLVLAGAVEMENHPVDDRIAGQVGGYWTMTVRTPPARLRIVPDGRVDLVFDLDSGEAHVGGAHEQSFEIVHERPTRLLGATLMPGAAPQILGVPASSLTAAWQPLARVIGEAASALSVRVRADGIAMLEAFMLARLAAKADPRVERAVRAIAVAEGDVDIARLGPETGASPRNLGRLFHEWVGLSPKKLARIVRAQAAIRMIGESVELAVIADRLGFSDQAHLTREVRAMAGAAPGRLAEIFKGKSDSFKND